MAPTPGVLDPKDVVAAPGHAPPELIPVIDDLLRTRYCIPGSVFLVESLRITPVSRSGRWRAVMLLLGDGQLCIQALLGGGLHRFVETGQIAVGAYLRAEEFLIRFQNLENDQEGSPQRMVYLAVEDAVTIGWNRSYQEAWQTQASEAKDELRAENDLDIEEASLEQGDVEAEKAQQEQRSVEPHQDSDSDEDDAFEDAFQAFEGRSSRQKTPFPAPTTQSSVSKRSQIVAMPRDWHDHQMPLKLTTLRSIPLLPYAQNWTCNVLGIVTSLSDVESSHLPPYRQRTARIADPSTTKRVHLTVFLNPEAFTPKVGSAVLLVGVKNHRFDGGSLKKYSSDTVPAQWWFEDPRHLGWLDVEGLVSWWGEVERSQNM